MDFAVELDGGPVFLNQAQPPCNQGAFQATKNQLFPDFLDSESVNHTLILYELRAYKMRDRPPSNFRILQARRSCMRSFGFNLLFVLSLLVLSSSAVHSEQIKVRHVEGASLGFLVVRTLRGEVIAYGELKQVVKPDGFVMDDMQFRFKDRSFYREITKFTENHVFHLVSDQVEQRGPSFKEESESWIDATSGQITV